MRLFVPHQRFANAWSLLDAWRDHLSLRFGGTPPSRPHLPVLPLGVDQEDLLEQRADFNSRDFLRGHLRLRTMS